VQRLRHYGLKRFAQPLDFLLPLAVAPRFVPRRIALEFRPLCRHLAQLHQPRFRGQAQPGHQPLRARREGLLAESADRATVRALIPHNGKEGQMALTGQGACTARKHPDTVRIEPQAGHPSGIVGRSAAGLLLVGSRAGASIQAGPGIEQKEDHVTCAPLGRRALRGLLIALGGPRAIRFATVFAHYRSPLDHVTERVYREGGIIA